MKRTISAIISTAVLLHGYVNGTFAQNAVRTAAEQECVILDQKQGSITFVVDENLPKPVNANIVYAMTQSERQEGLGDEYYTLDNSYIAASFWNMRMSDADAPFFTGMVQAFADHRPVALSPDVIWMLISQSFSHEVNSDSERFRDKFVDFDGKIDLTILSEKKLYDPLFDWASAVDGFARKIEENTKGDVARLLTADFSTTGTIERMASEIVLMETTQSFFEFIMIYLSCGIPSITLTGTVQDWQSVLDKTAGLTELGAGSWAQELIPVLEQFVKAAAGHPDRAFWQDMVMKNTPEHLRGGGCSRDTPTNLDGWFLKLLPFDKDGKRTPSKVPHTFNNFPKEMASVPVKYIEVSPSNGDVKNTVNLKLSGGIAGYTADEETGCVSFHLGWTVRKSDEDSNIERFQDNTDFLSLRVKKIPEEMRSVSSYGYLEIHFTDKVEIPEWFYGLTISRLIIYGNVPSDIRRQLKLHFSDVIFRTDN